MRGKWVRLLRDCRGATAIEYGLILALMVFVMLGGMSALGGSTSGLWRNNSDRLSEVMP